MTELKEFLASLYDALSEAEMQALQHGQQRLAELLASGTVPDDVALPVYHATDVEVTLDVGLRAEQTEEGTVMYVTDTETEEASALVFTVDLYDLIEEEDLEGLDYDDIISGPDEPDAEEQHEDKGPSYTPPPVGVIEGIEPQHAARLESEGIENLPDLAEASPEQLAERISGEGTEITVERTTEWLNQARALAAVLAEREGELAVELVDGIGPAFGNRLREHDIETLSELVERSPEEVAEMASTDEVTVSSERAAGWIERARERLQSLEELETESDSTDSTDNEQ